MLVLSRKCDESIIIGDDIVITILDICGDKVRIGINAPQEVPVYRSELYEKIVRMLLATGELKAGEKVVVPSHVHRRQERP